MKIAFIGQKGIPSKYGGVEKHVEDLALKMVEQGHEVFAYTRPNYTDKKLKEYKGIKLISIPSVYSKNLDAITHTLFSMIHVATKKVDIVHVHSIGPSSLLWLLKIIKPGTPIISTFHSKCYKHKKWGNFAKMYLKFGEKMACTMADRTISVSKGMKKYAKEKYNTEARYIPNGVTINKKLEANKIKEMWGLEKDSYIFAISRIVAHKGIHYIINAYNNLKTDKKLVIAGDGAFTDDYVKKIKDLAKNNKNIIFTGNQTGDVLTELYSNAYLLVQASEDEGLSIALLEALSFSLPVLVSDIPANVEIAKDVGFIFKNKDEKELEEKLNYLLNHPEVLEERKEQGKNLVDKEYNWNNISKNILELYKEVV